MFQEKPLPRNLNIDKVKEHGIDKSQFNNIKNGADGESENGQVIPNKELTLDPPAPKNYAFCSDTAYNENILPLVESVTALYHESTFLESDQHLGTKTKHSTAKEAATIANKAKVGKLILGHYSTRYKSIELFKEEAQTVFEKVILAEDGKVIEI